MTVEWDSLLWLTYPGQFASANLPWDNLPQDNSMPDNSIEGQVELQLTTTSKPFNLRKLKPKARQGLLQFICPSLELFHIELWRVSQDESAGVSCPILQSF